MGKRHGSGESRRRRRANGQGSLALSRNHEIHVVYKNKDHSEAQRIVAGFGRYAHDNGLDWEIVEIRTTAPAGEKLLDIAKTSMAIVYVHGEASIEDALNCEQAGELEDRLRERGCFFAVFQLTSIPLPFGFPRGFMKIRMAMGVGDPHIQEVANEIREAQLKCPVLIRTVQDAMLTAVNERPLSIVAASARPLLEQCAADQCLSHTAAYLLDWISYVSLQNEEEAWRPTLEHASKVLEYLVGLCGPLTRSSSSPNLFDKDCYPLESADDCFAALFGVLLHNQPLLRKVPGSPPAEYVEGAGCFLSRTKTLSDAIRSYVPEFPLRHVDAAFYIGIEMFRDSLYWRQGTQDNKNMAAAHDSDGHRYAGGNHAAISIALRMCDIMDIGHRTVPDLVRDVFNCASYLDGLRCYFRETFAVDKNFLFTERLSLVDKQLRLVWPAFKKDVDLEFLEKIRDIIDGRVSKTLNMLKMKGNHPNLAVQIVSTRSEHKLDEERLRHIVWAFFPLAIEYPPSDSVAAKVAIEVLPILVDYIYAADKNPKDDNRFTKIHVEDLLRVFGRLRRHSHYLPKIAETAREAVAGVKPENYSLSIKAALERRFPRQNGLKWLDSRRGSGERIHTNARRFYVYGISQPVTQWLVGLAEDVKETISVAFLYCRRKLIVPGPAFAENIEILSIDEHKAAKAYLLETMKSRNFSTERIQVEESCDFERFASAKHDKHDVEVLFGARNLLVAAGKPFAICNYGSNLLSLCAGELGVPVRLITGEDRFQECLTEYKPAKGLNAFSISYSLLDRPDAEDDIVPLDRISAVSTESRAYATKDACRILQAQARKVAAAEARRSIDDDRNSESKQTQDDRREKTSNTVKRIRATTRRPGPVRSQRESSAAPVMILTATQVEFDGAIELAGVRRSLRKRQCRVGEYISVDLGFEAFPVRLFRCSMGSSVPGGSLQRTLDALVSATSKPSAVILAGLAFGLRPGNQYLGDILLASHIQLYEPRRVGESNVIKRGDRAPCSTVLLDWFLMGAADWGHGQQKRSRPAVHRGLILTGEKLVDSKDLVARMLEEEPEAIGGEMEAAGVYSSAQALRTDWIVVKSICDWGMGKKSDCQKTAVRNVFDFVFHTLSQPVVSEALRCRGENCQ
jgi:nucleoside phosphorylase